jgi:tetratricopeptide (TPR) repeat protein
MRGASTLGVPTHSRTSAGTGIDWFSGEPNRNILSTAAILRQLGIWLALACCGVAGDPYQEALRAFSSERFDAAILILQGMGAGQSDVAPVQNLKALTLAELRRYPEALSSIRRARELAPANSNYAYNHALILFDMKDYEAAKRAFQDAIKQFGATTPLLSGLGDALLTLNEFEQAEKCLRQAITGELNGIAPWIVLTKLYYTIADRPNFQSAAEKTIVLAPENYQACYYYGLWLIEHAGKVLEGTRYIQKSIELQPRFVDGLRMQAQLQARQTNWEAAARTYQRILVLEPDDRQSLFLLYRTYQRLGQIEKAEHTLSRYRALLN